MWVANNLSDTVSQLNPTVNRAVYTIGVGNAPPGASSQIPKPVCTAPSSSPTADQWRKPVASAAQPVPAAGVASAA